MLPRRRDLLKNDKQPSTSSTTCEQKSNQTVASRGEKRKSTDSHHGEGSEYLRRKHNFIRSTIRVDYQPDICKDYKETGFCGFGDSCKFLHDRSDYKHGWQLEQEWATGQYRDEEDDKYLIKDDEEDERDDENLNVCPICREDFKDPIMTKCKHHFCGSCAEKECSDKCFVCKKPTSGIFKVAKINSQHPKSAATFCETVDKKEDESLLDDNESE